MASLLPSRGDSIADWRGSGQGFAALRDFGPAYRRFGSFASFRRATGLRDMSAIPPIAIAVDACRKPTHALQQNLIIRSPRRRARQHDQIGRIVLMAHPESDPEFSCLRITAGIVEPPRSLPAG